MKAGFSLVDMGHAPIDARSFFAVIDPPALSSSDLVLLQAISCQVDVDCGKRKVASSKMT